MNAATLEMIVNTGQELTGNDAYDHDPNPTSDMAAAHNFDALTL